MKPNIIGDTLKKEKRLRTDRDTFSDFLLAIAISGLIYVGFRSIVSLVFGY